MTDFKNKIKALAERNRLATTDEERAAVVAEMDALKMRTSRLSPKLWSLSSRTQQKTCRCSAWLSVLARLPTWCLWRT